MSRSIQASLALPGALISGLLLFGCTKAGPSNSRTALGVRSAELGTSHPVLLQEAPPDGRWLVFCQARSDTNGNGVIRVEHGRHGMLHGDRMEPYLILGNGPERPIDEFVAADEQGNYLVVVISERLLLIDPRTGREEDLSQRGANPMDVQYAAGSHRAASFDRLGQRLLYLRKTAKGDVPVIRTLATGQEVELDPGDGLVWRAQLDAEGKWAMLQMIDKDTDGDGKLALPSLRTNLAGRRCRGSVGSYGIRGLVGDRPSLRIAPTAGGKAREADNLVRPWGERLLLRTPDGALVLESASGQTQELVPASCKGTVLHSDIARGQILVQCQSSESPRMALYGAAAHVDFTEDPPRESGDIVKNQVLRFFQSPGALIDLERRSIQPLGQTRLVGHYGGRALLARGKQLALYDADTNTESELIAFKHYGRSVAQAGSMVLSLIWSSRTSPPGSPADKSVRPGPLTVPGIDDDGELVGRAMVVDLAAGKLIGQAPASALAVTADGRVLVPRKGSQDESLPEGPLQWMSVVPPLP